MAREATVPFVWASSAAGVDISDPGQTKQELGWVSEKPPHQYFNFTMNAHSDLLKSAEENGIIEWLDLTNYTLGALTWEAGLIYQSVQANTDQQPSLDVGNVYWALFESGGGGGGASNAASWATADQTQSGAYTILVADDTIRQIYTGTGEDQFTLDALTAADTFTAYVANAGSGRVILSDGTDDLKYIWPGDNTYKITWDSGRNQFDVSEV